MKEKDLKGRVAVVTGAARGVGREVALGLAEHGAHLALLDRCQAMETTTYPMASRQELDDALAEVEGLGLRATALQADVTSLTEMQCAIDVVVAEFGRVDIVVANAGILTFGRLWELTERQWDETIAVNLKGVWITLKTVLPHMIERGSGRVICISSTAGLRGSPTIGHYSAAKHGIVGLCRSLAMEVGGYGIAVNAVCPSRMKTPMVQNEQAFEAFAGPGASEADLDRLSRSEQVLPVDMVPATAVRDAVVWLASDAAAYVTGCAIPVDAGEMLV
jgi:SDR family mycofactocin-dependent oxidoreductase